MTVSEQIIQVLDALCDKFGIMVDWTSENVIPYLSTLCGKLVSYEIWTSVAWMAIMIVLCIASIVATKMLYPTFKRGVENQGTYEDGWTCASAIAVGGLCVLYLATVLVLGEQIMDIIECVTFPEKFVFEYIQNLIESGK